MNIEGQSITPSLSEDLQRTFAARGSCLPSNIRFEPDNVKNGLGQLVLTIVELLRELLERQAIRRMEAGSLSDTQVEALGTTFMRLSEEVDRLRDEFGLDEDDLNIDLGPLGKLL